MKKVLVVDGWDGWADWWQALPILDAEKTGAFRSVRTVREVCEFFNGEAQADILDILIVGGVEGAAEFVKDVRARFARLRIIGLAEHRVSLTNIGCSYFVARDALGSSMTAFFEQHRP
ncbi:MAG: hypothetical protein HYV67_00160 [Candidatus Taylorbacteria bacterium]|nr:hypothetical protein [Candidatus Taylorbacteria bacterium]